MKRTLPKQLSDRSLLQAVQTPFDKEMPQDVKDYLKQCEEEFYRRKIKLRFLGIKHHKIR